MKFIQKLLITIGMPLLLVFLGSCSKDNQPDPRSSDDYTNQLILDWNETAIAAMGGEKIEHTLLATRIYAMMHIAMHDALNAVAPVYNSYAFQEKALQANPIATASAAAHKVLVASLPQKQSFLDSALERSLLGMEDSESKTLGLRTGVKVANAMLSLGHHENSARNPIEMPAPPQKPGDYEVVPPLAFIYAPFWTQSQTWSLERPEQFRCPPPPSLSSAIYTADFEEVKVLGALNSTSRTADQSAYAKYWYELSPEGWNRIARIVSWDKNIGLMEAARLFALLNMGLADAYIAGWDSKVHFNLWRPYTAIRKADLDGNEATLADPSWEPAEPTPPIQDYPSTHSALGSAAATILAAVFGDETSFTMVSPSGPAGNNSRSFQSFSQAAEENADSRVMAGVHFRFACNAGLELGRKIAQWTLERQLQPLKP